VLDGEHERVARAAQVQIGVAPRVQVSRAAQPLTGLRAGGAVLSCVMGHDDCEVVLALQCAQVREQRGDVASIVLVDAVQAHEWIEQEQPRP